MIVAEFTPEEFGRIREAVRFMRRKTERSVTRDGFDPKLGAGSVQRMADLEALHLKLNALYRDA